MIPALTSNKDWQRIVVSTGNILNPDIHKLGIKSSEELLDSLELTKFENDGGVLHQIEPTAFGGQLLCGASELKDKLTENDRGAVNIGVKLFLNKPNSVEQLPNVVDALLNVLQVESVESLVLAYHPKPAPPPTSPGLLNGNAIVWNSCDDKSVDELKRLWSALEQFHQQKKICQLGVADLDLDTLKQLHAAAKIPPAIAQINLSSCCKVPEVMQEFCTQHDIQLLTHSDPEVMLTEENFSIPNYDLDWVLRYQVHLRCRGVLTAKGYILGASRKAAV